MSPQDRDDEGLRGRGEQALGDLTERLLDNPMLDSALAAAAGARDAALDAQRAAMSALNLSSAGEVERLERRLRMLSDRLESVEEQVDGMARDVAAIRRSPTRGADATGGRSRPKKSRS